MPKAIMYVETVPLPDQAADYHKWYNEVHLQEIVAIEGFVSARRFEPFGHEGPFIAIYEMDTDDLDAARSRLTETLRSSSRPVGLASDPPPTVHYFQEIAAYGP